MFGQPVDAIVQKLKTNDPQTQLVVVAGVLAATDLLQIADALPGNHVVKKLRIGAKDRATDYSMIDVLNLLGAAAKHPTLKSIGFCSDVPLQATDEDVAAIVSLLDGATLEELDLSGINLGFNVLAIVNTLRGNNTLRTLDLGQNTLLPESAQALIQALETNTTLVTFKSEGGATLGVAGPQIIRRIGELLTRNIHLAEEKAREQATGEKAQAAASSSGAASTGTQAASSSGGGAPSLTKGSTQ